MRSLMPAGQPSESRKPLSLLDSSTSLMANVALIRRFFGFTLLLAMSLSVSAQGVDLKQLTAGSSSDGFLKPDQAFVLTADSESADGITLRWRIARDYYLYRDKVVVTTTSPAAVLGAPVMPAGKTKHDDYFGEQVVYYDELVVNVPISRKSDLTELPIEVTYQGCAEAGLCYPPIRKQLAVALAPVATAMPSADVAASGRGGSTPMRSEQDSIAERVRTGGLLGVLLFFFVTGLGLAFTPCVLPMVPILSGIIVGAGGDQPVSRGRAFWLSAAYVLGMALTYTVAGALFALAGKQAQAFFQKPWMIALFAALFIWLALGMFGLYTLQMPAAIQARLSSISNRQKHGTLTGSAIMGALSSLIVTACVAPALVGALAVIGQGGDVLRGASALFAMSLGMGVPLLVVGASAGHLLPRVGPWMDAVKAVFGVLLLGVAVWMIGRLLPGPVTLALWAVLAFVSGYCLFTLGEREVRGGTDAVRRGVGALAVVYGVLMLIGALAGRSDPLQPLAGLGTGTDGAAPAQLAFTRVKTVADLEQQLATASAAGRPVMLDFYADWCVSCKEMERYTFTDPGVQAEFSRALLLQADVTANDAADQALLQHFGILGPPTIVFFGADGRERSEYRIVGYKPAVEFRAHIAQAFGVTT
jgi:thioredoxin:protein disulfide reductase